MPAGFYQVPGLPYPGRPGVPQATRPTVDPNGLLATAAAEQTPGPMSAAPGAQPMMGDPSVIRLAPSRTTPFSRADAQALAALDPRALDEAKAVAAVDQPKTMTATFGGQKYEMTPSARVDRNVLARLYAQAQERKGQERQDAVRGQEQAGKERIVSIPGEQLGKRREMELAAEERMAGKKAEAEAPVRQADIAAKNAQTAAATGAEQRAAAQAARQPSPAQEALERRAEALRSSPIQTNETRMQLEELERQILAGRGVPAQQAAVAARGAGGPAQDPLTVIDSDPAIQKIIEDATAKKTGWMSYLNPVSGQSNRARAEASRQLAMSAIRRAAQKYGMDPKEVEQYIVSKIGS